MKQVSSFEQNVLDVEAWELKLGGFLLTVDRWHPEDEMATEGDRTLEKPWSYKVDACNEAGESLSECNWLDGEGYATKELAMEAAKEALKEQFDAVLETTEAIPVYAGMSR